MSVRPFAAIARAALQLKPYQTARSLPVVAVAAGRYNWVTYCTASSSGEIAREPEMDQEKQTRPSVEIHESKTHTDVMVDSFGVEYTTRSEEEGFGVIYRAGEDDPDTNPGQDKNHPDDKKSEGSQVKENEKEKEKEKEKAHKP